MTTPLTPGELVPALAYALARADLPTDTDTSRDYAERLAPLVLDSGYLDRERRERVDPDPDPMLNDRLMDALGIDGVFVRDSAMPKLLRRLRAILAATEAATRDASPEPGEVCPYCGDRVTPDEAAEHKARVAAARIPTTPRPR